MQQPIDTSGQSARPNPSLATSVLRVSLIALVLGLSYVPWIPFPWKMPLVGLLGMGLVWAETRSVSSIGLQRHSIVRSLGWMALLLILVIGIVSPLVQPLVDYLTDSKTDYSAYGALRGNLPAAAHLIALAWLSAAVGEELVFRAFLMHHLAALMETLRGGRIVAAVLGGAVFGLMHSTQGISGIVITGIVGTLFGYVYLRSNRNLWAMVLAHGLIDTWGVTTLYLGWY